MQELKKCSPIQRICIEENAAHTFNCSVNCAGIYADVQWAEERITDEGSTGKKGQASQKKKYMSLVSEYKHFKEGVLQHFNFNPTSVPDFGKFQPSAF